MRGVHAAAGRLRRTHPKRNHTDPEGDGGCSAEAYEGGKAALKHRTTPKRADAARGGEGEGTALNDRATVERQTQSRGTEAGDDAERKRGCLWWAEETGELRGGRFQRNQSYQRNQSPPRAGEGSGTNAPRKQRRADADF